MSPQATEVSTTPLVVIVLYLLVLVGLGLASTRLFRGTSKDYFAASHTVGPVFPSIIVAYARS